ncbi:MAG: amine oxidase [Chitinophagales bacterium]
MAGLFNSFILGGYECADHINRSGERINLLFETEHHTRVYEDYYLLSSAGIKTVREGICWSYVERSPYTYDFSEVLNRINAARHYGIQQIWDVCHFGYPDDLIPTHPKFAHRFEALCKAFALFYKKHCNQQLLVCPINEISFLSWHSGDVRGTVPFAINSGFDIKYHLCKAAIAGIQALKDVLPDCRILTIEPLIKIHPRNNEDVSQLNEDQFQAMDMIAGRMCPELGGCEDYLDVLGFNYYFNNQWEHQGQPLPWPEYETKREALSTLLYKAVKRYNRPSFLSETGHFNYGRSLWLQEIWQELKILLNTDVDFQGMCLYPLIERPDWDDLTNLHKSGLWDFKDPADRARVVHKPSLDVLLEIQRELVELKSGAAIKAA